MPKSKFIDDPENPGEKILFTPERSRDHRREVYIDGIKHRIYFCKESYGEYCSFKAVKPIIKQNTTRELRQKYKMKMLDGLQELGDAIREGATHWHWNRQAISDLFYYIDCIQLYPNDIRCANELTKTKMTPLILKKIKHMANDIKKSYSRWELNVEACEAMCDLIRQIVV